MKIHIKLGPLFGGDTLYGKSTIIVLFQSTSIALFHIYFTVQEEGFKSFHFINLRDFGTLHRTEICSLLTNNLHDEISVVSSERYKSISSKISTGYTVKENYMRKQSLDE